MPDTTDGHDPTLAASPLALANEHHRGYTGALIARAAERVLMRGFTTLRGAGGPAHGIAKTIDEGIFPGPRICPSGHFVPQTSGHFDLRLPNDSHSRARNDSSFFERDWSFIADGVPEVRAHTREAIRGPWQGVHPRVKTSTAMAHLSRSTTFRSPSA